MKNVTTEVFGTCDAAFDQVREAFKTNFERRGDVGAAAAVTLNGEFVVDLFGGTAGPDGAQWKRDTIINVYSSTKTMAATCVVMLMDRGQVDADAPVARYWPEFAANGKEEMLVRHVMSHSAGLPGFDPPLANIEELYDMDAMAERLAAQAPLWEPGTAPGYHAVTLGNLQGEIVRRVTGKTLGTFFREEIAEPLGADFHIGLPPEHDARVGEMIPPDVLPGEVGDPKSIGVRALASAPSPPSNPARRAGGGPRSRLRVESATRAHSPVCFPHWLVGGRSTA